MARYSSSSDSSGGCLVVILILIALVVFLPMDCYRGVYPFGPASSADVAVHRTYVDHSGHGEGAKSHYMVGTDKGVFEVDNSWWLSIYNADEIYSGIRENHRYHVNIKGDKSVGWWWQDYPHITSASEIK